MNTPDGYVINESESVAYRYFERKGRRLVRKIQGCDFRLEGGPLVEVKTGVFRPMQMKEMVRDFENGHHPVLLVVGKKRILHFKLTDVEAIAED